MGFSDNDKNLAVTASATSIENSLLNDLYKDEYVENPLT